MSDEEFTAWVAGLIRAGHRVEQTVDPATGKWTVVAHDVPVHRPRYLGTISDRQRIDATPE
jgi:hypothetical protein